MSSLSASEEGLQIVDQARKKKGWTKTAASWCSAANTTEATLKRFWRQVPIQSETFAKICEVVGVKPDEVGDKSSPAFVAHAWTGNNPLMSQFFTAGYKN